MSTPVGSTGGPQGVRPTPPPTGTTPPTGTQGPQQEIRDNSGNVIGTLTGDEIRNSSGAVLGRVVRNASGEITSTAWNINQLGSLPANSPLRQQYNALQSDVTRRQQGLQSSTQELSGRIQGADRAARDASNELNELASGFFTAAFTGLTGTHTALENTIAAHNREAASLRGQRSQQQETAERVDRLVREGNLSEAHAILTNREQQYRQSMGNINRQTMQNLQAANQDLARAGASAARWESGLTTARNVCVVGGAIIATGGLASAGFVAAAVGGTVAGTTIGGLSNLAGAGSQVAHGNMDVNQALAQAGRQTLQDAITSAQVGVTGGVAGTAARGTGALIGTVRAGTLGGRLAIGGTAGTTAGFTGSVLNTGTNVAMGRETRTTGQIAVDTVTHTLLGTATGMLGAGAQFRLENLASQQGGTNTVLQQLLYRGGGEVLAPVALSAGGTYLAHATTGREAPHADEILTNAATSVLGAYTGNRVMAAHNNGATTVRQILSHEMPTVPRLFSRTAPPPPAQAPIVPGAQGTGGGSGTGGAPTIPAPQGQRTVISHEQLPASIRDSNAFRYANGNTRATHQHRNTTPRSVAVEVDSHLPSGSRPQAEVIVDPRTGARTTRIRMDQETYQRLQSGDQRALQAFQHELRHANRSNPVEVHVRDRDGNITRTRSAREYVAERALEEFQVRAGRGTGQGPNNANVRHVQEMQRLIASGDHRGAIRYARQNGVTQADLRNYGSNYATNRANPNRVVQTGNDARTVQNIANEIQNNSSIADALLQPGNERLLSLFTELANPSSQTSGQHFANAARNAGFASPQDARNALRTFLNEHGAPGRALRNDLLALAHQTEPAPHLDIASSGGSGPVSRVRSTTRDVEVVRNNDTGETSISISNRVSDAPIHNGLLQRIMTNLRAGRGIHDLSSREIKVEKTVGSRSLVCIHGRTNSRVYGVYDSSTNTLTWQGVAPDHNAWSTIINNFR